MYLCMYNWQKKLSLTFNWLRNKMHCWTITNNLSSIIFLIYFTNDNLWLWLFNQYIYTLQTLFPFLSQNKAEHIFYSFCTVINAVNYHCIIHIYYLEKTWKTHINHIVFTFHLLSFMLVIQLSYSYSGMPVKSYYYFSYESVLDFLIRKWMKHTARESVQRSVMFASFWIRIKRIQNDVTIFSLLI